MRVRIAAICEIAERLHEHAADRQIEGVVVAPRRGRARRQHEEPLLRRVVREQRRLELVRRDAGRGHLRRDVVEQVVVRQPFAHRTVEIAASQLSPHAAGEQGEQQPPLHWSTTADSGASVHAIGDRSVDGLVASASGHARSMKSASPLFVMHRRSVVGVRAGRCRARGIEHAVPRDVGDDVRAGRLDLAERGDQQRAERAGRRCRSCPRACCRGCRSPSDTGRTSRR